MPNGMRLISAKLPEALIDGMDELVRRGLYPNRSAVIRTAIRDLLKAELWDPEIRRLSRSIEEKAVKVGEAVDRLIEEAEKRLGVRDATPVAEVE